MTTMIVTQDNRNWWRDSRVSGKKTQDGTLTVSPLLFFHYCRDEKRKDEEENTAEAARRVYDRDYANLCKGPLNERKTRRQLRDPRALNYPGLSATR